VSQAPVSTSRRPEPVTLLFDVRSPWCYQTSRWLRRLAELGEVTLGWGVFSLEVVNLHDDEDPAGYDAEYGPALRVALALREEHGPAAIGDFYAAFGTRMWQTPAPAGPVSASPVPVSPVSVSPVPASPVPVSPVSVSPVSVSPVPASPVPASPVPASPAPGSAGLPDVPELTRQALADIGIDPGYAEAVLADERTWTAVLGEHRHWADELRVFGVPTLLIGDERRVLFGPVLRALPGDDDCRELWRHLHGLAALGTVYELKRFKSLQSRADLPNAVQRADLRVADMRAARALMGPGGPCAGASLEWTMGRVRAQRAAAVDGAGE
jgi:hypothetical protein